MSYFRLFPDCHYERGIVNAAIYNLSDSEVLYFDKNEAELLDKLLSNIAMEELTDNNLCDRLVNQLIEKGYGTIHDEAVIAETYIPYGEWTIEGLFEQPPILRSVTWQLSDKCNSNCSFCQDSSYHVFQGCNACLKWNKKNTSDRLHENDIENIITEISNLGVIHVTFSGGNPLLYWDLVCNAIRSLREKNPNVSIRINTNGYGLNADIAKQAKEIGLSFLFTVFADSPDRYDIITGSKELHGGLVKAVDICKEYYIPFVFNLLVIDKNRSYYLSMKDFVKQFGDTQLFSTELIPKVGVRENIVSFPIGEKRIEKVDIAELYSRKKFNTCLNGSIAITQDGSVSPCPSCEIKISKIPEESLNLIFKDKRINKYWSLTKKDIALCKDCEYKFSCSDCSVLEFAVNEDESVHKVFCSYKPNKGEWSNL